MAWTKGSFSFTLGGIKYTDIPGYNTDTRKFTIGVAGTAKMVRQYLLAKYGISGRDAVSVKSESYAGGDSIRVYLNNAPQDLYDRVNRDLNNQFEEGTFDGMTDSYTYTKKPEQSAEGDTYDYGTKYLFVENRMPYGSAATGTPNWGAMTPRGGSSSVPALSGKPTGGRGGRRGLSDNGTLLRTCGGWGIYRKQLPDGTMVVNAVKERSTTSNRGAWDEIRGEMLTEAGFAWNKRYQLFENRSLATGTDAEVNDGIERICRVLRKFYIDDTATQPPSAPAPSTPQPSSPQPTTHSAPTSTPIPTWPPPEPIVRTNISPNPKLEYCRITGAEGFWSYVNFYPRDFSSWTELTRFIEDNIQEIPKRGYDKHYIEWKWVGSDQIHNDRWDVSEYEADPRRYPNLYAFDLMRGLCYDAWKEDQSNVTDDDKEVVKIGKDGLELNDQQFNDLLTQFLSYYPNDPKRFRFNTPDERLQAFKDNYPLTYAMFNAPALSPRQVIEKKIATLQIASKYNPAAEALMRQLQTALRYI